MKRKIVFFRSYFLDFYKKQPEKVQRKIEYVLRLIETVDQVPSKFLKHLSGSDGLYEVRIEYSGNTYRIFCFFDEDQVVILLQGFHKKSQQTPKTELKRAERLKAEYFDEKEQ